jgi:xanthine dehydrogenase accessory factor
MPFASALHDSYEFEKLPFGPDAFILIATHSHQIDQELVEKNLRCEYRYLALVGSKRKALMTRERCLGKGFSQDEIERVHCPAGLDINAETPEEIAISILGQMIQVKRSAA